MPVYQAQQPAQPAYVQPARPAYDPPSTQPQAYDAPPPPFTSTSEEKFWLSVKLKQFLPLLTFSFDKYKKTCGNWKQFRYQFLQSKKVSALFYFNSKILSFFFDKRQIVETRVVVQLGK